MTSPGNVKYVLSEAPCCTALYLFVSISLMPYDLQCIFKWVLSLHVVVRAIYIFYFYGFVGVPYLKCSMFEGNLTDVRIYGNWRIEVSTRRSYLGVFNFVFRVFKTWYGVTSRSGVWPVCPVWPVLFFDAPQILYIKISIMEIICHSKLMEKYFGHFLTRVPELHWLKQPLPEIEFIDKADTIRKCI